MGVQATPMRGWKLVMPLYWLYSALQLLYGQLCPDKYSCPDARSKFACRCRTSSHGVCNSQRKPRFTVRFGVTRQSSWKNAAREFERCPQVPPLTPPWISEGRPSRKSASAMPLPLPDFVVVLEVVYWPLKLNVPASPLLPE